MMNAQAEYRPQAARFRAAADVIAGVSPADEAVSGLLDDLGYRNRDQAEDPHRAALLRTASLFTRLFSLRADHAPGLVALGAEVNPACLGVADAPTGSVSGTGLNLQEAFESCVGEAVEYLSQFPQPDDPLTQMAPEAALADAPESVRAIWERLLPYRRQPGVTMAAWAQAADMADGRSASLPADICYRRPVAARDFDVPWPLSIGCGAGPDLPRAALHGLLELIERDAVSLWWCGGMRGRIVPVGIGSEMLKRLRSGDTRRCTWLLDITSDVEVPVVAALSCNADGFGLCAGFACRPALGDAADAALRELMQLELAYQIVETKRSVQGEASLNDGDRHHIRRYTSVDTAAVPSLHPVAPPRALCDASRADTLAQIAAVRHRLASVGVECYVLNLTRAALGVPAVRVLCPGLEMSLTALPGPRLTAAAARSGLDPTAAPPL